MKVKFWGVRGSVNTHTVNNLRYGGHTTCIEVSAKDSSRLILDCGTGLPRIGENLMNELPPHRKKECVILLTHGHWDHVMGLPFFAPLFDPLWDVTLCGPAQIGGVALDVFIRNLFNPAMFPVAWESIAKPPNIVCLTNDDAFCTGPFTIIPCATNHPGGCLGYRIQADGSSIFFSGDHELGLNSSNLGIIAEAMSGAQLAVVDAQYTLMDYQNKQGWGHSAMEQWPPLASSLGVKGLVLTHFDPSYSDVQLDSFLKQLRATHVNISMPIIMAQEGLEIGHSLSLHLDKLTTEQQECPYCAFSRELLDFSDTSIIVDRLLSEVRSQTGADAGTIYLREGNSLVFAYSQNDTLFTASQSARQQYLRSSLSIDARSISGFAALNNTMLNIPDVRQLPVGVPYSFNESFDIATGYRTVSSCASPLRNADGSVIGVLQVINCMDDGQPVPFTAAMQKRIEALSVLGAQAIERANMVRDMILRMLKTSALRDPKETASHVMRVGSMVAEIYYHWAERHNVEIQEIFQVKAKLRLAAMLHDVGKVGIPDAILRKPGKLDPEERKCIEEHCALGANLFQDATWDLDIMAREIALHHHQKWNGLGYTGDPAYPPLAGLDIPLGARITAVADVFDALVSTRCYKEAWEPERAFAVIIEERGKHFDPDVVDSFLEIKDTIMAVQSRFPD